MRSVGYVLGAVGLGAGVWFLTREPTVTYPPGMFIRGEPRQSPDETFETRHNGYRLTSAARYDLTARVVLKTRYRTSRSSTLAPFDFGVAWDRAADEAIQSKLRLEHSQRFLFYQFDGILPLDPGALQVRMSNVHLIPANPTVFQQLDAVKRGQFVRLKGYLVNASHPDGFQWRTSFSRTDTGGGACEILYVQSVQTVEPKRIYGSRN